MKLPNSTRSGNESLYKIELDPWELKALSIESIRELARNPRPTFYDDEDIDTNEFAAKWFRDEVKYYENSNHASKEAPLQTTSIKNTDPPACIIDLYKNGIKRVSTRNPATLCLAVYLRDKGELLQEAINIILPWARRIPKSLTGARGSKLKNSTMSAIKSVYDNPVKYKFSCGYIRNLGSIHNRINCNWQDCRLRKEAQKAQSVGEGE